MDLSTENPILFLDIDGVLNRLCGPQRTNSKGPIGLEKDLVDNLGVIMDNIPDLQIVISSTWRICDMARLYAELKDKGFKYSDRIVATTPITQERIRGFEVKQFLEENSIMHDNYAVVDDEVVDIEGHIPLNKTVHVSNASGLKENSLFRVLRILGMDGSEAYSISYEEKEETNERDVLKYL